MRRIVTILKNYANKMDEKIVGATVKRSENIQEHTKNLIYRYIPIFRFESIERSRSSIKSYQNKEFQLV